MKAWWVFAGFTLLAYVLQTVPPLFDFPLIDFDFLLIVALAAALAMPVFDARLAAFLVGLAFDLGTSGAVGPRAFSFGLAGLLVTMLREAVNIGFWPARFAVAAGPAVLASVMLLLYRRFWSDVALTGTGRVFWSDVLSALVAALIAALLLELPVFGRARARERHSPRRWG